MSSASIEAAILEQLRSLTYDDASVDARKGFMEMGLDSLDVVKLVNLLKERLPSARELTSTSLFEFGTPADLAKHLADGGEQRYAPPPHGYAPPPHSYAPPPHGYAPPPHGYAPPPHGYAPPPQGYAAFSAAPRSAPGGPTAGGGMPQVDIQAAVLEQLRSLTYDDASVDARKGFMEMGLDSLDVVKLVNLLKERLPSARELTSTSLFEFGTPADLAKHLADGASPNAPGALLPQGRQPMAPLAMSYAPSPTMHYDAPPAHHAPLAAAPPKPPPTARRPDVMNEYQTWPHGYVAIATLLKSLPLLHSLEAGAGTLGDLASELHANRGASARTKPHEEPDGESAP